MCALGMVIDHTTPGLAVVGLVGNKDQAMKQQTVCCPSWRMRSYVGDTPNCIAAVIREQQ